MMNQKVEMAQVKQDHDQKPNANLMLSVNMSGLGHQVKLESDCDTGNMQMQLHNTSDEVCVKHFDQSATDLSPIQRKKQLNSVFFLIFSVWSNVGTTISNWIYGFNGTDQSHATMVLGELSAIGKCESGVFEEFIAHP